MALPEVPRLAHQIINLVGSVVGRAEMLLEGMDESDPMREDLVKMIRAGQEAAGLTRMLADTVGPQSEVVR
jgi:signal transduction histidine kinase